MDEPARTARPIGAGWVIARPFGVPLDVSPAWFLVAALLTWGFASTVQAAVPGLGLWRYAVSLAFALLLSLSVLVHELSHTVVALRAGLPVARISLHVLGGATQLGRPAATPGREAGIALAGPVVSLLIAAGGLAAVGATEPGTVGRLLAQALMLANLLVGAFNLLPGLPLDGGRVLAAAVWRGTGRRHTGTVVAGHVGRVLALGVVSAPFFWAYRRGGAVTLVDLAWAVLLGAVLWSGAGAAVRQAGLAQRLPGLSARGLTRRAIPVRPDLPLGEALRQAQAAGAGGLVVVDAGGAPIGLVVEHRVRAVPPQRAAWVAVGDLSRRLQPELTLPADLGGEDLVRAMTAHPASEYLVVEPTGQVYGLLAACDVEGALSAVG